MGSTVPNLLYLHRYTGNKVCRVLCTCSGWFKHIEPPRTISNHIITKIARYVEFCHISSGWFDCTEPSLSTSLQGQQGMQGVVHLFGVVQAHRTSSNHIITKIARCVEFCHMSSGWFDHTEPSLSTSLQGKQGKVWKLLSHEFGVVRPYRTFSVYIVTSETRSAGCLCTSSGWFKHIEPHRTFSNHIITEIAKCVEFCHMSSGWFDHTEPSLSGVQGAYALVRGGSSTSNHVEPSRTTSLQR